METINAFEVTPRKINSLYPEPFAKLMNGRMKRQLGDFFNLKKFGINLTLLKPNGISALKHSHSKQEEFIFILSGHPILHLGSKEIQLSPSSCAGFSPNGPAHKLENRTNEEVWYLEVGDREIGDQVTYPDDDLLAKMNEQGSWIFTHKDGLPY
jgi:uncharacterized cupin superfamily protein